jgi:V/A-type H+-transporting ATPase subunit I
VGLRPTAARWFEVLTPADELARAVETLAATGQVEIEAERAIDRPSELPTRALDTFRALQRRYSVHWPRADFRARMRPGAPLTILDESVAALEAWAHAAEPLITRKERLETERTKLSLFAELGEASEAALAELWRMREAGPRLAARVFVLDREKRVPDPRRAIVRTTETPAHVFLSVLAQSDELEMLERDLEGSEALSFDLPEDAEKSALLARLERVKSELDTIGANVGALSDAHGLPTRIADVERLDWFLTNVPPLDCTRHFTLITGWTSDRDASALRSALADAGVHALIRFPAAHSEPPILLSNPPWAKAFESLSRLLGTPSSVEADPSIVLVVLAPLLFGFMFADVGHGALLVVFGFALRKRVPALGMLIPGGVAAMLFGALFGSVFGSEQILPALWLHPLEEPLLLLGASLVLGAGVLVFGMLLSALEAHWQRCTGRWLASDGTLLLVYLGCLAAIAHPAGLFVAATGTLVHALVAFLRAPDGRMRSLFSALGELVERGVQLGVNTVSFARVGAFALAHAGLSIAVMELGEAAGPYAGIVVLVLGNALVLVLEGLVVGIQTTRLVLFEFFVRFLRAEGRPFVPLAPPASDEAMTGAHK